MRKKLKLKILDMHCSSCAFDIDGGLEETSGVKSSKTSYAKGECEVEFDEHEVTPEKILKVVEKTGYKAQVVN